MLPAELPRRAAPQLRGEEAEPGQALPGPAPHVYLCTPKVLFSEHHVSESDHHFLFGTVLPDESL